MIFTSLCFILCFSIIYTDTILPFSVNCFYIKEHDTYSFSTLSSNTNPKLNITISDTPKEYILINFCHSFITEINKTNISSSIIYNNTQSNTIYSLSSSIPNKQITINSDNSFFLSFPPGSSCISDPSLNYTIHFHLTCGDTLHYGSPILDTSSFNISKCNNTITGSAREICPSSNYYTLNAFTSKYSPLIILIFFSIGTFLLTFGAKFYEISGELIGVISFMTVLLLNIYIISDFKLNTIWFVCSIGVLFGSLFSLLLSKASKLNYLVTNVLMGYYISHGVFYILCGIFTEMKGIVFVFWVNIAVWVSVGLAIGFRMGSGMYYVGCSVIGGYCFVKAIALIMGKEYNVMKVLDLYRNEEWEQVKDYRKNMKGIVYLIIVWIIIAIGGCVGQRILNKKRDKENSDFLEINKNIDNKSLV